MEFILNWINLFQAISSKFTFSWQKSPPSSTQTETFFQTRIIHFRQFPSILVSAGRKCQQLKRVIFYTGFIHFIQFPATSGLASRKEPSTQELNREKFQTGFIHFRKFQATLVSAGRKAPSREPNKQFFRLNFSISSNFQQVWVQLAVKPPSRKTGFFLFWLYQFHGISSNFAFSWQKNPQPQNQMEFFQTGFIHFRPFSATLGSAGRKASSQEPNRQFFRLNLSISCNFQQLWVQLAVKLPHQRPNRQKSQTRFIYFSYFPATLGSAGS